MQGWGHYFNPFLVSGAELYIFCISPKSGFLKMELTGQNSERGNAY